MTIKRTTTAGKITGGSSLFVKVATILAFTSAIAMTGCENDDDSSVDWNNGGGGTSEPSEQTQTTVNDDGTASASSDAVPFGSLKWSYGGVSGSGAKQSGVTISRLDFSANGLSFRYDKDLSAWGMSHGNAGALACLFVKTNSGAWVGGKFDWISSSRTSREFTNVKSGYRGWSLSNVPNPCQAAFVIIDSNGKRRSNVLVETWKR